MSIAVMNWVWQHSPTSGNERLVLLAIADACSRDDGTGAWPAVPTIARKANISPRTVQRVIGRLTAVGHLHVDHAAGPHGSNAYRIDMTEPVDNTLDSVDNTPVKMTGRQSDEGDTGDGGGVTQLCHRGGVTAVSPEPPRTTDEPPPPRARVRAAEPDPTGGGENHDEDNDTVNFFAALGSDGSDWPLSHSQRRRLTHRVEDALAAGWSPGELAAHVGANTDGIRNPYAVLHTRLRDLPTPPHTSRWPSRPPWCGSCVQSTRRLEGPDGNDLGRCPHCHPLTVTAQHAS